MPSIVYLVIGNLNRTVVAKLLRIFSGGTIRRVGLLLSMFRTKYR